MNKRDPKFWALIGFGVGAVSASAGSISNPLDSILGGLLQAIIWYLIANVIIKKRKRLSLSQKKSNYNSEHQITDEKSNTKINMLEFSQEQISLGAIFAIVYALGVAGALISFWQDAGTIKVINPNSTVLQQIDRFFNIILSISGFIDVFVFPSLFAALLITFSVKMYRVSRSKLRNQKLRFPVAAAIVFSAIIIWILFNLILVKILS